MNETEFLKIEGLRRSYGPVLALDSIDLEIIRGEFFSLLGPSGCGKTTLLRLIAGLDFPDSGQIILNGQNLAGQPADKRPINTVFQTYALFPHLTIFENIAFGLRMRRTDRSELSNRVKQVMKLVEIESLRSRKPHELSGGQKQRVALARAVVNEPSILLLDEPMAAIDLRLRKQLQTSLRTLQQNLGITFVYVTHDQEEALLMSDRVAIMNAGGIEQIGTPRELYQYPRTEFVAGFLGSCNVLHGNLSLVDNQTFLNCEVGRLLVDKIPTGLFGSNCAVSASIRAEQIILRSEPDSPNTLPGQVKRIDYLGATAQILLKIREKEIAVSIRGTETTDLQAGRTTYAHFPPATLRILSS